jgi:hypothetical protein
MPPPKNACRRAAATANIFVRRAAEALPSFALFDFVFYVHC